MESCNVIACLGPDGSFSELAAKKFCPEAEIKLTRTFAEAAEKLYSGEADGAALPIENSTQGGVRQNLDILERYAEFYAVRELVLPIDHRLALRRGVKISDVERIYSHEQAIGQCLVFLRETFPNAEYIYTDSTAASLDLLDNRSAGIVGPHVFRQGLVVSEQNIADEKTNQTHFLLVRKGKRYLPEQSKKVFVCAYLSHRPGSLLKFLQTIESFGLNLTKIESRPIPAAPGEYRFFIEFEGNTSDKTVQYALATLEDHSRRFRLLGAY